SLAQQREARGIGACDIFKHWTADLRVGAYIVQTEGGVTPGLYISRTRDARGDIAAAFGRSRQDQVGCRHGRYLDMQVDAVKQRARQAALIFRRASVAGAALAGKARVARATATAGIHRRNEHEP